MFGKLLAAAFVVMAGVSAYGTFFGSSPLVEMDCANDKPIRVIDSRTGFELHTTLEELEVKGATYEKMCVAPRGFLQ